MQKPDSTDLGVLIRALEAASYAMQKHAPKECHREIRYAEETLARFKGLPNELSEENLESILFNATTMLQGFRDYGEKMREIGRGFSPSAEMPVDALLEKARVYYALRFPGRTIP